MTHGKEEVSSSRDGAVGGALGRAAGGATKPSISTWDPKGGQPTYALETMLRIHFLLLWNSRRDQGTRDDLLDMDIILFR